MNAVLNHFGMILAWRLNSAMRSARSTPLSRSGQLHQLPLMTSQTPEKEKAMTTPRRLPVQARPDQSKRVMAVTIGLLAGIIAALMAYMLCLHLGGTPLVGLGYSGGSFIALTSLIVTLEKELGLL